MEKVADVLFKVLVWLGLVIVWIVISGVILIVLSPFTMYTNYIYLAITLVFFALAIALRKKIKGGVLVALIYATILSVIINSVFYVGMANYLSEYSKDKWIKYTNHRYYMLEDLRNEYELVGLSETEIKNLLGEPECIVDRIDGYYVYEYGTGFRTFVDEYVLEIVFKDGVSVHIAEGEH